MPPPLLTSKEPPPLFLLRQKIARSLARSDDDTRRSGAVLLLLGGAGVGFAGVGARGVVLGTAVWVSMFEVRKTGMGKDEGRKGKGEREKGGSTDFFSAASRAADLGSSLKMRRFSKKQYLYFISPHPSIGFSLSLPFTSLQQPIHQANGKNQRKTSLTPHNKPRSQPHSSPPSRPRTAAGCSRSNPRYVPGTSSSCTVSRCRP